MRIRDWSSDVCSSDLTIPLPDTKGRIDHLAVDLADRRLFVAEIANGTVDAIDLDTGKVIGRIVGLAEQQGVAWLPAEHELVVAFGAGSVHFYGTGIRGLGRFDLGNADDTGRGAWSEERRVGKEGV